MEIWLYQLILFNEANPLLAAILEDVQFETKKDFRTI
jgi:hypothetical protein